MKLIIKGALGLHLLSSKLERDVFGRITKREAIFGTQTETIQYYYSERTDIFSAICSNIHLCPNSSLGILKEARSTNGVLQSEIHYEYKYDKHGNVEFIAFDEPFAENMRSIFVYKNIYVNDLLTETITIFENDGMEHEKTLYFYDDRNRIAKIERYNRIYGKDSESEEFRLYQIEDIAFEDDIIKKSVYLNNGILTHYDIMEIEDNKIIKRYLLNPAEGRYFWYISEFENKFEQGFCIIETSEETFNIELLQEILDYIITKKDPQKRLIVIINCGDSLPDAAFYEEGEEVVSHFKEKGLDISCAR